MDDAAPDGALKAMLRLRLHPKAYRLAQTALQDWERKPSDDRRAEIARHALRSLCEFWNIEVLSLDSVDDARCALGLVDLTARLR
jgi:hypothetical protein